MIPIIIRKRTLTLVAVGLIGITLLFLGWRGNLLEKKMVVPGTPVISPVAEEAGSGGTGQPGSGMEQFGKTVTNPTVAEEHDFFVDYRLERERTRGQRVEWLREVINNANSAGETRQKAQEHLLAISRSMEKEVELENMIKAKGFKDAAVLVDERSVTVIVESERLAAGDSASIKELVSRGTGVDPQNVVIITRSSY